MARNEGENHEREIWEDNGEEDFIFNWNTMQRISRYFAYLKLNISDEIPEFIHYTKDLKFDDRPDYSYLKRLFKTIMDKEKYEFDNLYDWFTIKKSDKEEGKLNNRKTN